MSYEDQNSLNDLDVAEPLDGASPAELLLAFRQLKAVVKNALLTAHHPDGRIRTGSVSELEANVVGAAQITTKAVTAGKIDDKAVTTVTLDDLAVTAAKLGAKSVEEDKYDDASIPARAYKSNTIPLTALSGFITSLYLSSHGSNDSLRAVTENAIANNAVVDRAVRDVSVGKLTGGNNLDLLINLAGIWTPIAISGALTYDSNLGTFAVSSGLKVAVVADAKSRGTAGGAGVAGTWNIRTLGEMSDEYNLLTFSANKFKLVLGKYFFYVTCPAHQVNGHQIRLFDVTNDTVIAWGSSAHCEPGAISSQTDSVLMGFFEVTDADTEYQIEHWIETHTDGNDFGVVASSNNTLPATSAPFSNHREIYSQGFLFQIP